MPKRAAPLYVAARNGHTIWSMAENWWEHGITRHTISASNMDALPWPSSPMSGRRVQHYIIESGAGIPPSGAILLIENSAQYGYVSDTNQDSGIQMVKEMLLNGYILNFPTYINSWQWKTISNDPSATTADDAFVGKKCAYWVNGTAGYHAMTVVGYNDDIWVDINGNGYVDAGEKGAFRIANSWGTGWQEDGFAWMAYDALKNPSAVIGGPSTSRVLGWSPARAHWVTATTSYQPSMVAEFTLNHLKRNQLRLTLGTSDPAATLPSVTWQPKMIYSQGGAYAFDGLRQPSTGPLFLIFPISRRRERKPKNIISVCTIVRPATRCSCHHIGSLM